jgi:hypothetical protein
VPLDVDTLNSQVFLTQYHDYGLVGALDVTGRSSNMLTKVGKTFICDRFAIPCAFFEQWDPSDYLDVLTENRSSQFKQWDPGKFIRSCNFYNLEDKVGLDGVGIDTSKDSGYNDLRLKIESNELVRPKRILLHLTSGITMLPFSSDSLVLEDW